MSNLTDRKALTAAGAKAIAAAAEAEANGNSWAVSFAIVDAGGHLLHLQRLDGAGAGTAATATAKARTAAIFGVETKMLEGMVKEGRNGVLNLPDALPLEGGVPITVDGALVGAVGVSGVSSDMDAQIARAGIAAVV